MKSALIVIFNQDFSINVPKLNRLYEDRFSDIFYLTPDFYGKLRPFYDQDAKTPIALVNGLDSAVSKTRRFLKKRNPHELDRSLRPQYGKQLIRTVGYQFHFYHFISQAWAKISKQTDADWFWVIGDDVLFNRQIDEHTLSKALGVTSDTDCVVCDPEFHLIYEDWVNRFAGSEQSAIDRLKLLCGSSGYERILHNYSKSARGQESSRVIGGFSDFFGFRRSLAPSIMERFGSANRLRLFVELAVPNILLSLTDSVIFTNDYIFWDYPENRYNWQQTTQMLLDDPQKLFAHPVKFSRIDEDASSEFR